MSIDTLRPRCKLHFESETTYLSLHPQLFATSGGDHLRLWDTETGTCSLTLQVNRGSMARSHISGAGSKIASVSHRFTSSSSGQTKSFYTVQLWNTRDGTSVRASKEVEDLEPLVEFSPDSSILGWASRDDVELWNTLNGTAIHTLGSPSFQIRQLSFSFNGSYFAWSFHGGCRVNIQRIEGSLSTYRTVGTDVREVKLDDHGTLKGPDMANIRLSLDGCWLLFSGDNHLWLPPEYRRNVRVSGGCAVILRDDNQLVTIKVVE